MPWKTTCPVEQRRRFIHEFLRNKIPVSRLCQHWDISRKTAYKWLDRYEEGGRAGLADLSRAARTVHNRPGSLWLKRLERWRHRHPTWGGIRAVWYRRGKRRR